MFGKILLELSTYSKCGSNNGPLELLSSLVPFLGNIFLLSLLVLPSIKDSPGNFSRVTLQQMSLVGSTRQEPKTNQRSKGFIFFFNFTIKVT